MQDPDRVDSDDADSDLEELQGDIAKFDESVRQFLASHQEAKQTGSSTRGLYRGRGGHRGPRKAAKPRGDITARLSKVNQAFLAGDYDQALDLAFEVIRINAETFQAWTALSSIFDEQGDTSKALSAKVYAAHLRPKDVEGWMRCADYAFATMVGNEAGNLHMARLCYSAALRANPRHLEARIGKATVCHQQGHFGMAVSEYNNVLKQRPGDIDLVRKLAEACVETRQTESSVPLAIAAYRRYFDIELEQSSGGSQISLWHDVGIYVDLFASTGRYAEAISEVKRLARWLLGRGMDTFWDDWDRDDREWDNDSTRRDEVRPRPVSFDETSNAQFGDSLPLDLRTRLAIYRLKNQDVSEALQHIASLDPESEHTVALVEDYPFQAYDLACELSYHDHPALARPYLELLRARFQEPDAGVLLQLGKCHLVLGDTSAAEEAFLAAIDADEMAIEPRIQLANIYESAKESEEALILAAEAMALRRAQLGETATGSDQGLDSHNAVSQDGTSDHATALMKARAATAKHGQQTRDYSKTVIPRRYRAKRLADPTKRLQDEQAHAIKLAQRFQHVTDLKRRIATGETELLPEWMASSKDLIDEFRSRKRFYSWDKYLGFLGPQTTAHEGPNTSSETDLARLYQRLTQSIAPGDHSSSHLEGGTNNDSHQGILFDKWLNLFLDYAIGLAIEGRRDESYQVCESARDSTVFQSPEHNFSIHLAWSVCAIYASDESKAITVARHLMRDMSSSDGARIYSLLAILCQSPISWYTSGPAQKYILRQIKLIDAGQEDGTQQQLDVSLLMLYGHILFTSTSYTYALSYFLRARSLDPDNPLINLSIGLAYIHNSLKRQASNRQYLLLQGHAYFSLYASLEGQRSNGGGTAESYYNIGRLFQLLGITHLAIEYYTRALDEARSTEVDANIASLTLVNYANALLTVKNQVLALAIVKGGLRL